jgi:hypothetical protein
MLQSVHFTNKPSFLFFPQRKEHPTVNLLELRVAQGIQIGRGNGIPLLFYYLPNAGFKTCSTFPVKKQAISKAFCWPWTFVMLCVLSCLHL